MSRLLAVLAVVVIVGLGAYVLVSGPWLRNVPCCCEPILFQSIPPGSDVKEFYGDRYICS